MTVWKFSDRVSLANGRIPEEDAARQRTTAEAICERLATQPGVILADDVGMGKTFVALAVAVSVIDANRGDQVVVMIPSAVAQKWPTEWAVFKENCLAPGSPIRATEKTVTRGSDFLKLLDDDVASRRHIIFMTHQALASNLNDPWAKLAVIRQAFRYQRNLTTQRQAFPRWAASVLQRTDFTPEVVARLLDAPPDRWRSIWDRMAKTPLDDDPVAASVCRALENVDLSDLRAALERVPLRSGPKLQDRLSALRKELADSIRTVWTNALRNFDTKLPLLILDEAHHVKNPNQLRSLFSGDGALGGVFERMLLLTATPFQLGHQELLSVLDLFGWTHTGPEDLAAYRGRMKDLASCLDRAHAASLRLDQAWSRLGPTDVSDLPANWWNLAADELPESVAGPLGFVAGASARLEDAEAALRPWVIRHSKPRHRTYSPGALAHPRHEGHADVGLPIAADSVLPFLLAARAQAVVSQLGIRDSRKTRAFFADGLASSFEAFLETCDSRDNAKDEADDEASEQAMPEVAWYLDWIKQSLPRDGDARLARHPKVDATVERTLELWRRGEKVLIFCFYRATGRALRKHLSAALTREVVSMGRIALNLPDGSDSEVFEALSRRADTLLASDSRAGRALLDRASEIGLAAGLGIDDAPRFGNIVLRFLRTPSFFVRYVDLVGDDNEAAVVAALERPDDSGEALRQRMDAFARGAAKQTDVEREKLWSALETITTGRHRAGDVDFSSTESSEASDGADGVMLLPDVRLANGETSRELRERLMLTFNTPFLPDVLVASSVMAEGVDLHRNCRHVIHHDLDWNPSTLEQRTGRVDRIGSKALACGLPIEVYEPYVSGTQDEKQYRVVKDRDKWFGVLMGGRMPASEWDSDRVAERLPLPLELERRLSLDLAIHRAEPMA